MRLLCPHERCFCSQIRLTVPDALRILLLARHCQGISRTPRWFWIHFPQPNGHLTMDGQTNGACCPGLITAALVKVSGSAV